MDEPHEDGENELEEEERLSEEDGKDVQLRQMDEPHEDGGESGVEEEERLSEENEEDEDVKDSKKISKNDFVEMEAEVEGEEDPVDDDEEEENSEDRDFISEPKQPRRKRLRKQREDRLDEDDYALVEEATGRRVERDIDQDIDDDDDNKEDTGHRKFKRLKHARSTRGDATEFVAADAGDLEAQMFGDDDDDEAEDAEAEDIRQQQDLYAEEDDDGDSFVEGGYAQEGDNMNKLVEIFGAGVSDFFNAVNPGDVVEEATESIKASEGVDPSARDVNFMSKKDDEIRRKDIPERLQERMNLRRSDKAPKKEDIDEEAKWIEKHAFEGQGNLLKIIATVLRLIKIEMYEIPVIANTRREYCPIEEEKLWLIDEWDEKWDRM